MSPAAGAKRADNVPDEGKGVRLSVITPDKDFETATGCKADKSYKLYNGNKVCHLNNYFRLDKENG